ncbi:MAG: hypothetical protein KGI90_09205 [Burkholderiales bacterium]|nr:hypothetical protein [Burkholderiales bacterium]
MNRNQVLAALLLSASLTTRSAWASPVDPGDTTRSAPLVEMTGAPDAPAALPASDALHGSSGNKTVDLLIELQARSQGIAGNAAAASKAGSAPRRSRLAEAAGADRPTPLPQAPHFGGLFSGTASSPQADQLAAFDPRAGTAPGYGPGDGGGRDVASAPWLMRLLAWPRDAVGFIRDHRHWVLAAVLAVLALMWLRRPGTDLRRR